MNINTTYLFYNHEHNYITVNNGAVPQISNTTITHLHNNKIIITTNMSAFRDRGVPKPTSECAACPSPDGSSAWASAKGGSEVAGDGRERGGNPAAFVFVPRPGRVRLQ
jgi:hypothetical protein